MVKIAQPIFWLVVLFISVAAVGVATAFWVPSNLIPQWANSDPIFLDEDDGPPGIETDPRFTTYDEHPLFPALSNEEFAQKLVNVICANAFCFDMSRYEYLLDDQDRGMTGGFTMKLKPQYVEQDKPTPPGGYHHCRFRNERWLICMHDKIEWNLYPFEPGGSHSTVTPLPLPAKADQD